MAKAWEYIVVAAQTVDPGVLGQHGRDGWELVALHPGPEHLVQMIFKRQMRGKHE